ncbi:MAG: NDP-sugar synthase [Sulfolobales archaeon]|nr:NDP-sugar synthase [Sulfolobales archaeon]MDW7969473.1 NDP-sugar synthase [Sulfolobales archaeon]
MTGGLACSMKAIVLAGGFATRLRPLTLTKPKPLLPILDKPLLDWILDSLTKSGCNDVVVSVKYLADVIKKYLNSNSYGMNLSFAEEVRPLGDAGPIRLINDLYGLSTTFLVVYGDIFSNIDFGEVIEFHRSHGGLATMVVTEVDDPSRYGAAIFNEEGKVVKFVEKPPKEKYVSNNVNAGVYVFEPEVLKYIPESPSKLARDVLPKLVSDGVLYAYKHEGVWMDIGLPSDYLKANFEAMRHYFPNGYVSNSASIDGAELIQPSYISANVKLGKMCKVGPYAVIGGNSVIGPAVRIKNSLLFNNVIVDEGVLISNSLVGERSIVGKWVRIESGSVIGDEVIIRDEVLIPRRTIILPYKEVDSNIDKEGDVLL